LTLRRARAARTPADPRDIRGLAQLEFDLGTLQRIDNEPAAAEQSFRSAAQRLEQLRSTSAPGDGQRSLATVYQRLAEVQLYQGKSELAVDSAQKAVTEAEMQWKRGEQGPDARSALAAAAFQLAETLADRQRYPEALDRVRQARALLEAALDENPLDAKQTRILLYALNAENRYLAQLDDRSGAIVVATHALDVADEALRRDPRDNWSRLAMAIAVKTLGISLAEAGNQAESVRRFREALAFANKAAAQDPANTFARLEIASGEHNLAMALVSSSRHPDVVEGCALLRRVQTFWSDLQAKGDLPAPELAELRQIPRWLAHCRP
jgi:tetratricopeptide (TPR) repeat protein